MFSIIYICLYSHIHNNTLMLDFSSLLGLVQAAICFVSWQTPPTDPSLPLVSDHILQEPIEKYVQPLSSFPCASLGISHTCSRMSPVLAAGGSIRDNC